MPLMWAELWREKWGEPDETAFADYRDESIETRLRDAYERREETKRKRAIDQKRDRWRRREWLISSNGNPYIKIQEFLVVTFWKKDLWHVVVENTLTDESIYSRRGYSSMDDSRDAAFDLFLMMQARSRSASPELVMRK